MGAYAARRNSHSRPGEGQRRGPKGRGEQSLAKYSSWMLQIRRSVLLVRVEGQVARRQRRRYENSGPILLVSWEGAAERF